MLQAPPGAGKTTIVPLSLLGERWLGGSARVIMLEPRRLAARAAAHRMAHLLGERVGDTVGFRVRRETRVSARTRIEVVTEGVLTRMLNSDPTLDGVGAVLFDEFHERSIHADLGLALTRHTQRLVRDDLRIVVMSATLDGEPVAHLLGDAPIITSEGRTFPVEVRWLPRRPDEWLEPAVARAIRLALRETEGDLLVFLPGQGEIHRVMSLLSNDSLGVEVDLAPLYGNLSFDEQDRAIAPSRPGRRKVVLATSIAETSLTIEGVRCVVDSGVSRVPRWAPGVGMTRLETVRVSRASAAQRAGRAGRTAPGVCYRLWAMEEEGALLPFTPPEIVSADLAPLALDLAAAGVEDVLSLDWLDPPTPAALAQARELLTELDALHDDRITPHGEAMARIPAHPRIAHMLLRSDPPNDRALACDIAALIADRDPLRSDGPPSSGAAHDADIRVRLELLDAMRRGDRLPDRAAGMRVSREVIARALDESKAWRRELRLSNDVQPSDDVGRLLALAFPDRVGQSRSGNEGRFLLRNGNGVRFHDSPALARSPWIVMAESDGRRPEARVYLAAALDEQDVERDFADQMERVDRVFWDDATQSVRATRAERLGAITVRERPLPDPSSEQVQGVLADAVRASRLTLLNWSEGATRLRERLAFIAAHETSWPPVDDASLMATLDDWLSPHLAGKRSAHDLRSLDVSTLLLERLSWQQRGQLDALAPTHFEAPTGNRIRIDYSDPNAPVVAVRLQEMFGCTVTPRVLLERIPVTLQLLSPAHRPVQVTRDLAGFWRTSYFDVKRELKGRYPKHVWPDDPLTATPTHRAKPRGT